MAYQKDILNIKESLEKQINSLIEKYPESPTVINCKLYIEQAIGIFASDLLQLNLKNTENDSDFKKVVHKKKNNSVDKFKMHSIEMKQGMFLDNIKNHYTIFKDINNKDIISDLKFYFKDDDFFDKRGGLYIYTKGDDIYYICENKYLYKFDKDNNLVIGEFNGKKQIWKEKDE